MSAPSAQAAPEAGGAAAPPATDAPATEPGQASAPAGDSGGHGPGKVGGAEAAHIDAEQPGRGSNRHMHELGADRRFAGDAVAGDKTVYNLFDGQKSAPLRPLSPSQEGFVRFTFVAPNGWDDLRVDFRDRRTVLLCGAPGHGRKTMAIRLLQTVEAAVIYELDPRVDLARMAERLAGQPFARGTAFLLCQPEDITRLDAYTFQSIEAALTAADARLVVTIGPEAQLRDDGLLRYQLQLPEAPARREILLRHLTYRLEDDEDRAAEILEPEEVEALVAETLERDGITCEVTAHLATLLSREGDRVDAARIRAQLRRRHTDEFEMWFDGLADLELRCFAIALAALHGLPYEEVARAARLLYDRLCDGGPVTLDDDSTLRVTGTDPFHNAPARLLRALQARTTETTVVTDYGRAPATTISYLDPEYAKRVIERAWRSHRIQDHLLDWLRDLVTSRSDQVRVYAGTTVGAIACVAFEYVRRSVLQPWADSDELHDREAVADALRVASGVPALRPAAVWLVDGWYRSGNVNMQSTAAIALGTRLGETDTTRSVRALERLTKVDDFAVRLGICRGFSSLLVKDPEGLVPLFYGVVERCLADPRRAVTAQLTFLLVAGDLLTDVHHPDGTIVRHPTLLHLAQRHAHLRRPLFLFWARALAGGSWINVAHIVLRYWAAYAESNPDILDALIRMVRAVNQIDPMAGAAIQRLARKWNGDEELIPMPNVGRAVGGVLNPEPLER
ncbi:hypothetical protein [Phytohabitans kaempferiae]|uniref:AAA+ ATPase domain-containing protein n=1 Tax=Phytohabitans kaempferiae TaxID=1620943 RepID=A0ABV6MFH8_9ACTN